MNKPDSSNAHLVGAVLQIAPEHSEMFGACFLQVTEVKPWGVQGFVRVPGGGNAFVRPKWEHLEVIGMAAWVDADTAMGDRE